MASEARFQELSQQLEQERGRIASLQQRAEQEAAQRAAAEARYSDASQELEAQRSSLAGLQVGAVPQGRAPRAFHWWLSMLPTLCGLCPLLF